MRPRFLFLVLIFLAAALFAQEIPLSTPRYGPAPGDQLAPKVATNGSDFLVAWNDYRGGPGAVYAQRVRSGTVLDGTGIRVADGATLFGVFRAGSVYTLIMTKGLDVVAASIDDDGVLIEPLHTVMSGIYPRAAASNGSRILVADSDRIAILDERGYLLALDVFSPPTASWVGLGSNGSTFLLVTGTYANAHTTVHFIALDANGRILGTSQRDDDASSERPPVIASNGNDYLVVYMRVGGENVAASVDRAGAVKSMSALPANGLYFASSALQWSGSTYLLAALSYTMNQMAITTIAPDGTLGPAYPLGPATPGAAQVPGMAWNGGEALIAWTAGVPMDPNGRELVAAFVAGDGSVGSAPMTIPSSGNPQRSPAIASGGANDLAVWNEATYDVYAARVPRGGAALDGGGILVAHDAYQPRVVFDGEAYLVAWLNNGVHAQRVDATTGALLGDSTTLFGTCASSFDLGRDDAGVLLVVQDCSNQLFAQRAGVAGPVGGPVPITPSDMLSAVPHMAWNGSEWLIVWDKLIQVPGPVFVPAYRGNVYAERLSSALAVLDPQPIAIAVSPFNTNEWLPIVASDGRDFLVAWTHQWPDPGIGVRARTLHADGGVGDTVQLVEGAASAHSIVWDSTRYAVAYDVARADASHQLELTHGDDRIVISDGPEQHDVGLAMSGGTLRAVYARVAPEPIYGGVYRVFVRDFIAARRRVAGR